MDYEGPEGKLKYNFALYLTSALDGVGGQRHALTALATENRPVPIIQESGCVPGPKWTGFDSRTFNPVASCYSDYVIPVHITVRDWICLWNTFN
jgi:hypothetical protein